MKLLKFGLRFWIILTSVVSFVGGWIMLAHAPRPNQNNSLYSNVSAPIPTLEPLPALSDYQPDANNNSIQSWFNLQPRQNLGFRPTFRTGGS